MKKIDQLKALIKERHASLSNDARGASYDINDEWFSGQYSGLTDGVEALEAVLKLVESWDEAL